MKNPQKLSLFTPFYGTSTGSRMNFKEADQNHVRGDQLKNMDEQKVLSGQQLMDLPIRSVLIVLDLIYQTSVEQLVESAMCARNWDIICECVQTARMGGG